VNNECVIDADELRRLDGEGVNITRLALHFKCSTHTIRKRMDLAGIARLHRSTPRTVDPTPEEIAERAAECLARRPPEMQRPDRWTPPHLLWDGQAFRVLG